MKEAVEGGSRRRQCKKYLFLLRSWESLLKKIPLCVPVVVSSFALYTTAKQTDLFTLQRSMSRYFTRDTWRILLVQSNCMVARSSDEREIGALWHHLALHEPALRGLSSNGQISYFVYMLQRHPRMASNRFSKRLSTDVSGDEDSAGSGELNYDLGRAGAGAADGATRDRRMMQSSPLAAISRPSLHSSALISGQKEAVEERVRSVPYGGDVEAAVEAQASPAVIEDMLRRRGCRLGNALFQACARGLTEQAQVILEGGEAKLDEPDGAGLTPLHLAASSYHLDTCEMLIAHDADVSRPTPDGNTALHYIVRCGRAEDLAQFVRVLLLLLERGASAVLPNALGETPLHLAALRGYVPCVEKLLKHALVDVSLQTSAGETCLHYAARSGSLATVRALLDYGASVSASGKNGTCLDIARDLGHSDVANFLESVQYTFTGAQHQLDAFRMVFSNSFEAGALEVSPPLHCCSRGVHAAVESSRGSLYVGGAGIYYFHRAAGKWALLWSRYSLDEGDGVVLRAREAIEDAPRAGELVIDPGTAVEFHSFDDVAAVRALVKRSATRLARRRMTQSESPSASPGGKGRRTSSKPVAAYARPVRSTPLELERVVPESPAVRDRYGFWIREEMWPAYDAYHHQYLQSVLPAQRRQWSRYQAAGTLDTAASLRAEPLRKAVYGGVPPDARARLWWALVGDFVRAECPDPERLAAPLVSLGAAVRKDISLDIPRTFPGNAAFDTERVRALLGVVLQSYAVRNPSTGYCQSMNFLAGMLLVVFEYDAVRAFWVLAYIIENVMVEYYGPLMVGLVVDQKVLVELVNDRFPDLIPHLEEMSSPVPVLATRWMMCIFVNCLPTEAALRVWDAVLLDGRPALFSVILALLGCTESDLMRQDSPADIRVFVDQFCSTLYDPTPLMREAHDILRAPVRDTTLEDRMAKLSDAFFDETASRLSRNVRRNDISFLAQQTVFAEDHLEELHDQYMALVRKSASDAPGLSLALFTNALRSAFPNWIVASREDLRRLFRALDRNGDNYVDFCELIQGFSSLSKSPEAVLVLAFSMYGSSRGAPVMACADVGECVDMLNRVFAPLGDEDDAEDDAEEDAQGLPIARGSRNLRELDLAMSPDAGALYFSPNQRPSRKPAPSASPTEDDEDVDESPRVVAALHLLSPDNGPVSRDNFVQWVLQRRPEIREGILDHLRFVQTTRLTL